MMLDINNVFTILRMSTLSDDLKESCLQFADQHAPKILASQDFKTLQQETVEEILSRDSFCADEIDIFKAVCDWVRAQPWTKGTEELFKGFIWKKCLRLDLMSPEELLSTVRRSEIFERNSVALRDFILDAVDRRTKGPVSDIRQPAVLDKNVATAELGAVVVEGESKETLLSGAQGKSDSTSLTRHRIGNPEGIVVQLGRPYTINSVTVEIGNCGQGTTYGYDIEVSMDRQHWQRVGSHCGCQCRPVHEVVFSARLVRYIRVLGSWSSNEYFSLVSFEALFSTEKLARDVRRDECRKAAIFLSVLAEEIASCIRIDRRGFRLIDSFELANSFFYIELEILPKDVFHVQQIRGQISATIKRYKDLIGYIQVAQVPSRDEPHTAGEIDYKYVFGELKAANPNWTIGLEHNFHEATNGAPRDWVQKLGLSM